jgi:putative sigma-54 modulation protein
MDLQIRTVDVHVTDEIRAAAERHASRLDRWVDRIVDAKLELRRQAQRTGGEVTIAQVTLQTGRAILRSEERDTDPVRAVDAVLQKLERQARRHHEKKADRFGRRPLNDHTPTVETLSDELLAEDEGEPEEAIVRTKRFPVKPMDSSEAIEQMELLGHDFYLFENLDARTISLVYRRRDGSYGLLIPEPM